MGGNGWIWGVVKYSDTLAGWKLGCMRRSFEFLAVFRGFMAEMALIGRCKILRQWGDGCFG